MSSDAKRPNVYGISRDLWDHPVFADEAFTEIQAWAWLVGAAAWKRIQARGNVGPLTLERGEFSFSIRFLGERWDWKKDKVHRFLNKLKKHDMLCDSERDGNSVFLISNYNKYQIVGLPKSAEGETPSATAPRQHRDKEETGETENKERKKKAAPVAQPIPGLQFPPWWPTKEWQDYLDMRKKKRAPATDRAVELLIAEVTRLRALGNDPAAVLNRSVLKSWTDVYQLPEAGRGRAGGSDLFGEAGIQTTNVGGWLGRLELFHHGAEDVPVGFWATKWGPAPGQPGCAVPPEAMAAYAARHAPRLAAGGGT